MVFNGVETKLVRKATALLGDLQIMFHFPGRTSPLLLTFCADFRIKSECALCWEEKKSERCSNDQPEVVSINDNHSYRLVTTTTTTTITTTIMSKDDSLESSCVAFNGVGLAYQEFSCVYPQLTPFYSS